MSDLSLLLVALNETFFKMLWTDFSLKHGVTVSWIRIKLTWAFLGFASLVNFIFSLDHETWTQVSFYKIILHKKAEAALVSISVPYKCLLHVINIIFGWAKCNDKYHTHAVKGAHRFKHKRQSMCTLTTLMSWANDTISCTVTSSEPFVAGRISLL